jgi:uncharacterized membrane protein YeaQ/YmgE (transglycosylase-associated protein family)
MTYEAEPTRAKSSTDGRGFIGKDSKLGLLVFTVITVVGQAVVEWLGELDFSTAPRVIASLAPVAIGLVSGWITTKISPRH